MITLDEAAIAREIQRVWGLSSTFVEVNTPLHEVDLTSAEQEAYQTAKSEGRRHGQWLLGRAALRRLIDDTGSMRFPHPSISLTHIPKSAYALKMACQTNGIGLDVESYRQMKPEWARFFLTEAEQAYVSTQISLTAQSTALLRLWTLKEALYKADCDNASWDLMDYSLTHPQQWTGEARHVHNGRAFRYHSLKVGSLWIAIGIAL